jgi:cytidylate kinase
VRVIAIDGPAASGKTSTAALVAEQLRWAHLDSGALYRALTLVALDHLPEDQWSGQRIIGLAEDLPVRLVLAGQLFRPEVAGVDVEQAIRSDRVTTRVSTLAAIPDVRTWVNTQQRRAVAGHPEGVVVDGRDIGTVVFPDAPLKIYLTAHADERAKRRLSQRGEVPDAAMLARESAVLAARDAQDAGRAVAPLRAAPDALVLDTTALTLEEQVTQILTLARATFPE